MQEELFRACLAVVPTKHVLMEAGFVFERPDSEALLFVGGAPGSLLRITAGLDMFQTHWQLLATMNSERTAMCEEFFFLENEVRGTILKRLWEIWQSAYKDLPPPVAFGVGRELKEYEAAKKAMDPGPPTLSVDGEMLRMVIRRYRNELISSDPASRLRLSYSDRQLRLETHTSTFYCPAWGHWFGTAEVDAISFAGLAPRSFYGGRASIKFVDGMLWFEGNRLPGLWRNETEPSPSVVSTDGPITTGPHVAQSPLEKLHAISMCPCLYTNSNIPRTNHKDLGEDSDWRRVTTYQCAWCGVGWLRVHYRNDSFSRSGRYYRIPILETALETLSLANAVATIELANYRIVGGELYRSRERCEFGPGGRVDLYF